jgi:hypothetical protein
MSISSNDLTSTINSGFKYGGGSFQIGFIINTSNNLINYTSNTSNNLSELIKNTNNDTITISNNFNNYTSNVSNFILINASNTSNTSFVNSNNLSDFIKVNSNTSLIYSNNLANISLSNSNNLSDFIKVNSNNLFNLSSTNSNNLSDFIKVNSNTSVTNSNNLFNLSLTNSNNIANYISSNSNIFNNRLITLNINTDTITQGSSNRFIVNDIYNRNITFTNSLFSSNIITSNLSVIGDTTTLNTTIYQTEQLQVVNDTTATAMIVKQVNTNRNVAEFYHQNNLLGLIINSNGNVGIGITNPLNKLHVNGDINTSSLFISGSNIQSIITTNSNNLINHISYTSNILSTSSSILSSGGTMTGQLTLSTAAGNNPITINSSNANGNNSINIKNNSTGNAFIGVGGSAYGGYYANNLFFESSVSSIIFNTNGRTSTSVPNMIINSSGNVGIGTTNPTCLLTLNNSVNFKIISLYDNGLTNNFQYVGLGANNGLCFNTFSSADAFQFRVGASTTTANEVMRINGNGSVCIGTALATSANTKLTISGSSSGYSQPLVNITQSSGIWDGNYALQVSGYTNLGGFRINGSDTGNSIYQTILNSNMGFGLNPANTSGNILFTTYGSGGNIIFYTSGANERMKIDANGLITTSNNIDCGGGIAITGSSAFVNTSSIDAGNLTNTYINFKYGGSGNDWCYLRQIGGENEYKMALDFHDDGSEARFCIRGITSTATPDSITEVFTVDNGNVYCTGNMGVGNNAPPVKLYVAGDIASTGDITAYYSDIRLKDIHSTIKNPLDIINNLNGFYYTPNELAKSFGIIKNKMEIGLSAQDVQNVLPELVNIAPFDMSLDENGNIKSKSGDNYLTISYERIVPILIEGIKEQNKKISNLENEINEIKKIYSKLLTKFE